MIKKDVSLEVLKVIESGEQGKTGSYEIAVVRWNAGEKKLEKRGYYIDKATGEKLPGKCAGFSVADLEMLKEKLPEIIEFMKSSK